MKSQVKSGKSFEYAVAYQLQEIAEASLLENTHLRTARAYFDDSDPIEQEKSMRAAKEIVIFLTAEDDRIEQKVCSVRLQSDQAGAKGDVRDIIIQTPSGDIGISAKNRHFGVKNPRLSDSIDFGQKWLGYSVSQHYWDTVLPIFQELRDMSKSGQLWADVPDKEERFYVPLLRAFNVELQHIYINHKESTARKLLHYLLGHYDFYKVAKNNGTAIVQSFNIRGGLKWGKKLALPTTIEQHRGITRTTTLYSFDKGWQITFRIHSAERKVTPSLKFDVQLTGLPHNLSKQQMEYMF